MSKLKVIDVSYSQGKIDWEKVKGNIDGAILRCGYGDDIASQDDAQWSRNVSECERLGIPYGVYFYTYATTMDHARSEISHIQRLLKGRKLSYPVYIDIEWTNGNGIAPKNFNANYIIPICEAIEKMGFWAGIYASLSYFRDTIKGSLDAYTKWVAQYNVTCDMDCDMWQYTSGGKVPGISGNVDMNKCYKNFPSIIGGNSGSTDTDTPAQPSGSMPTDKKVHTYYRARTEKHGWLPEVMDLLDFAGWEESPITDIAIRVSEGSLKYRVHTPDGWLPWVTGYDINDIVNGFAGNHTPIDGIEIYYYTPDSIRPYKRAKYRVAPVGGSYYSYQYDNETGNGQDGYAGDLSSKIGKFQLCIE